MSIRVLVSGARGRMGSTACGAVTAADDMQLVAETDAGDDLAAAIVAHSPDVAVDFTVPGAVDANVETLLQAGVHVVCGTTGLERSRAEQLGELAAESEVGFLLAPNFAIGVILMQRFAREAAAHFADVEIIELHHEQKQDAPSGTALATARQIAAASPGTINPNRPEETELVAGSRGGDHEGIRLHSVRLPGLLAHQEVLFGGPGQLLSLRHDTSDRQAFMPGVLLGVRRIREHRGLVDSLEHLL